MIRFVISGIGALVALVLISPLLLLLVPFWTFAVLLNFVQAMLTKRHMPWGRIMQFEPEIGWKPRPNLNTLYLDRIGDSCSIETDAEGWPGPHSLEESDTVAIGDSFAFGYGSKTKAAYYSHMNGCRIKAISAPGYSMVQEVMLMRQYSHRLKGKLVVWFICVENDLADNVKAYKPKLGYTNPFVRRKNGSGEWEIASDHVRSNKWLFVDEKAGNKLLYSTLCTPSACSERIFSASEFLIREAKKICDDCGAELAVFLIPYKDMLTEAGQRRFRKLLKNKKAFDPGYPEQTLTNICRSLSIPTIAEASKLTPEDYKVRDGHWNRHGNRKVARVLAEYHQKRAAVKNAPSSPQKVKLQGAV